MGWFESVKEALSTAGQAVSDIAKEVTTLGKAETQTFDTGKIQEAQDVAKQVVSDIGKEITTLGKAETATFDAGTIQKVQTKARELVSGAGDTVSDIGKKAVEIKEKVTPWHGEAGETLISEVTERIEPLVTKAKETIESVKEKLAPVGEVSIRGRELTSKNAEEISTYAAGVAEKYKIDPKVARETTAIIYEALGRLPDEVTWKYFSPEVEEIEISGVGDLVRNAQMMETLEDYVDIGKYKKDVEVLNAELAGLPKDIQARVDEYSRGVEAVGSKWADKIDDEGVFTGTEEEYREYSSEIDGLNNILSAEEISALDDYVKSYERFERDWKYSQPLVDEYYARSLAASEKFEELSMWQKVQYQALKEPGEFAKTVGISLIPVYGTVKYWDAMPGWAKGASVAGDILFIIPIVGQISSGIKGGLSFARAIGRAAKTAVVSPIMPFIHPIAGFKTMIAPIETLVRGRKLPHSVIWRGTYGPHAISKVDVGASPLVTREAMAEISRLATKGRPAKATAVGRLIEFSPTGLQDVVGQVTIHSTSHISSPGEAFLVVMRGKEPALYTAPVGYYGRLGEAPVAVSKVGEELGTIAKGGKIVSKGEEIGGIIEKAKVLDLRGKKLGEFIDGAVVSEGEVVGRVAERGMVLDKAGEIIGYFPSGTEIVNIYGMKVGKLTSRPGYMMIATRGVQELPEYVMSARTMKEMEERFFELVRAGQIDKNKLFEVSKQWKNWMELENEYVAGARLVPVLDREGRPVVYWTRGVGGERISVPYLQEVSTDWFKGGLNTARELSKQEAKVIRNVNLSRVKNIPSTAGECLEDWLRAHPDATLYGGIVDYTQIRRVRIPTDLDLAFPNPSKAANELSDIIRRESTFSTRVVETPYGVAVEVFKDGIWKKAIDIHPSIPKELPYGLRAGKTVNIGGIDVETLGSQLTRKFVESVEDWDKNPLRFRDIAEELLKSGGKETRVGLEEFIGGIGAKPFTKIQLAELKARGVYNTIRDIFKKELTVSERYGKLTAVAPDLVDNFGRVIRTEGELARAAAALRTPALGSAARVALNNRIEVLRAEYNRACQRLQDGLTDRFAPERAERLPERAERERVERPKIERPERPERPELARVEQPEIERPERPEIVRTPEVPRVERPPEVPRVPRPPRPPEVPRGPRPPEVPRVPRPPEVPEVPRVPQPPKPPEVLLWPVEEEEKKRIEIPAGSITWRQGMLKVGGELRPVWKYIPPPFDQPKPITLLAPPAGAVRVEMRTPKETVQMVGEPSGPVPERISVDLGIADIYVTNFGRNIEYKGKGLETVVGKRIMLPEKGMSISGEVPPGRRWVSPKRLEKYTERELGIEEERAAKKLKNNRLVSKETIPEMLEIFK